MTLPSDLILPLRPEQIKSDDPNQLEEYIRDLIYELTNMYQNIAQNVNGSLQQWTPIAFGKTTTGIGTYTQQVGWYLRRGLIVDLWMDITWTAHTGTGGLAILLPYKAAKSSGEPWVGVIQSQSAANNFGAGYTYLLWKVDQNTNTGSIVCNGSLQPPAEQQIANIGSYVGHIRYVGQEFEN